MTDISHSRVDVLAELDALAEHSQPRPWSFEADRYRDCDVIRSTEADVCQTKNTDSGTCRDTSFIVTLVNNYEALSSELKAAREALTAGIALRNGVEAQDMGLRLPAHTSWPFNPGSYADLLHKFDTAVKEWRRLRERGE